MVVSGQGGFRPALVALLFGAIVCGWFLMPPRQTFHFEGFENHGGMILYLGVSLGIAFIGGAMRTARIEALTNAHDALTKKQEAEKALRERSQAVEELRITLESIGDAVITTDTAGRVTFLNPAAQQLTGWKSEGAKGTSLLEVFNIVNEASREPVENPALRALKEGVIVGLANHTILIARDGTERPIDDSAAPIRDSQRSINGAVLVFRDITERKKSEDALRESESRKAAILQAALDAIITIDSAGKIIAFNPVAVALLGYSEEEAMGANMGELIVPFPYREAHQQGMKHYLATGEGPVLNKRLELPARCKDGSQIKPRAWGRDAGGSPVRLLPDAPRSVRAGSSV